MEDGGGPACVRLLGVMDGLIDGGSDGRISGIAN